MDTDCEYRAIMIQILDKYQKARVQETSANSNNQFEIRLLCFHLNSDYVNCAQAKPFCITS